MLNILTKNAKYTYIPGTPGTPGSAYVPASPAYCVDNTSAGYWVSQEDLQSQMPRCVNSWIEQDALDPNKYLVYIYSSGVMYMATAYSLEAAIDILTENATCYGTTGTESTQTCYPATAEIPAVAPTPATPAQTLIDNNVGWNAGAISVIGLSGDGGFRWSVGKNTTGAVVGFASPNDGVGIADINHGFYYASTQGGIVVIEGGAIKSGVISYTEGDVLSVRRINGEVTYWKNDVKLFTSAYSSVGAKYLDVSLYTAGDYVYDPAIFYVSALKATATATTSAKLSRRLRSKTTSAKAGYFASSRKGSIVDCGGTAASTTAIGMSKLRGILQLSAKGT